MGINQYNWSNNFCFSREKILGLNYLYFFASWVKLTHRPKHEIRSTSGCSMIP